MSGEHEPSEPYLWDRSAPEDPEIAKLERVLAPLAWKATPAPIPSPRDAVPSPPERPRSWARRVVPPVFLAGVLAAAGFLVGRQSVRSTPVASATGSSIPLPASTLAAATPSADRVPAAPPSTCTAASRDGAALGYEVLDGAIACDGGEGPAKGFLPLGAWLETDGRSRVMLEVADIGHVEIAPSTKLRILAGAGKEHRLELRRGVIHARINAPPRLFVVETEAATAVDLGCVYTLEIGDDGAGVLMVSRGLVALEKTGASIVVERGMMAELRPGHPPGTPFATDASADLRRALTAWDFDGGGLTAVLDAASDTDGFTLLSVLARASTSSDRIATAKRIGALLTLPRDLSWDDVGHGTPATLQRIRDAVTAHR